jgi:hypothetical protein
MLSLQLRDYQIARLILGPSGNLDPVKIVPEQLSLLEVDTVLVLVRAALALVKLEFQIASSYV